jgi:hypothetical protein
VDHLELSYRSIDGNDLTYSPVPCVEGQFFNDKWPTRFDVARVDAFTGAALLYSASTSIGAPGPVDVTLDLAP